MEYQGFLSAGDSVTKKGPQRQMSTDDSTLKYTTGVYFVGLEEYQLTVTP